MIISLIYIVLSLLGLSFLIFIHELGHYWMARRVGMRVETFSIGFGRPIWSWEHDGVMWQVGWLLFGGYVKIAGTELDKDKDPYAVKDGFFGRPPLDRIKVALMGPVANLVFALLAFTLLWAVGGREKRFSDFTHKIGWVDPESELYANGVRPGDEITAYDDHAYQNAKDHIYLPMTEGTSITVKGLKVDYDHGNKIPFDYKVTPYPHPATLDKDILTAGIIQPASYIIYQDGSLAENSPLYDSGIEPGDRVMWVNGEQLFSIQQLHYLISENRVLLTIQRGSETLLARVPRVSSQELRFDPTFRDELTDWQFAEKLQGNKQQGLYVLPYRLTNQDVVGAPLKFIDKEKETEFFAEEPYSPLDAPLQTGDKILAIYGIPVKNAAELLRELQTYRVNIIAQRDPSLEKPIPSTGEDTIYDLEAHRADLNKIIQSLGTASPIVHAGDFYLLKPVAPKGRSDLAGVSDKQTAQKDLSDQKKAISAITDTQHRNRVMRQLEHQEKYLYLGLPSVQDRKVEYNPNPFALFGVVFQEIWWTLSSLVTGMLNPKWIVGPVGIIQIVHSTSMSSIKEAFYWLGAISLNLGILNLLPIPVLDGGSIVMSLVEMITRRRLPPKTLEKLILPFAILLIAFFLYLTYNDILRLFK